MTKNAENTSAPYTSPPIAIILAIILLIFFFIVFFSIYFCRYFMEKLLYMWYFRRSPVGTPVGPAGANGSQGLDPLTIESFPAFPYSSVKDLRKEKYGLECAICLSEFLDDDILRLLTTCCHVFYQECIDLWLESHKTCPVCRMSLDALEKSPTNYCAKHEIDENEAIEDTFSITIKDDNDQDRGGKSDGAENLAEQSNESQNKREKFSRSHSTGHSIVRAKGAEDKFTLRLPEHLHAKIIRGHNRTGSCTTFGEYKSKTTIGNGGFGEVSDFSGGDVNKV